MATGRLTNKQFDTFKLEFQTITDLYKQEFSQQKPTDWKQYEKQWANRLRVALQEIKTTIDKASAAIHVNPKPFGRPSKTSAEQKTLILLQKDLAQFSSRKMADLMPMFAFLEEVETSYKTIQRAYSDPMVRLIIHNMFILLVKEKGIKHPHATGDGTGYSLTITKHYRSVRESSGEAAKTNEEPATADSRQGKRKLFTYSFAILDLESGMYVGYGASLRSEKAAFAAALAIMRECGVEPESIRLDQYYAGQSTAELFGAKTALYVIPKSNATIRGSYVWKDMIWDLMQYPFLFLREYFRRERSESGFSADKRFDGWKIWQKREDRILTAQILKGVWHNLLWIGG